MIPNARAYFFLCESTVYYLRRRSTSGEGIVTLGVSVRRAAAARRISLGGEGNVLYL